MAAEESFGGALVYACPSPAALLLQPVGAQEQAGLETQLVAIRAGSDVPFMFAGVPVRDWNGALSPWQVDGSVEILREVVVELRVLLFGVCTEIDVSAHGTAVLCEEPVDCKKVPVLQKGTVGFCCEPLAFGEAALDKRAAEAVYRRQIPVD